MKLKRSPKSCGWFPPYSAAHLHLLTPLSQWRERQQLEIAQRSEVSEKRKQETIVKAQQDIDDFYENYNTKRDKAVQETRYPLPSRPLASYADDVGIDARRRSSWTIARTRLQVELRGSGLRSWWICRTRELRPERAIRRSSELC